MPARPRPFVHRLQAPAIPRRLLLSYVGGAFTYCCWWLVAMWAGRSGLLRRLHGMQGRSLEWLPRPSAAARAPLVRAAVLRMALLGAVLLECASLRAPRLHLRRGVARGLSWAMILAGLVALADAGVTLVWQEPLSALYATIRQEDLGNSLQALERATPTRALAQRLALLHRVDERMALLAEQLESKAAEGSAVGRIEIPRIGADFVVVNGTATADLQEGPGIYSRAAYPRRTFPGLSGTTPIAGHRTTFLAPFRHIDQLRRGDRIVVSMPYGRFIYTVRGRRVVLPGDVAAAVDPVGHPRLVLSACTPLFSASHRILVFAPLTSSSPLGAARAYAQGLAAGAYTPSALAKEVGLPDRGLSGRI